MKLSDAVRRAGATVNFDARGRPQRFNDVERAELLARVRDADCVELAEVAKLRDGAELFQRQLAAAASAQLKTSCGSPSVRRTAVLLIDAAYERPDQYPGDDLTAEFSAMQSVLARANAAGAPVIEVQWPNFFETHSTLKTMRGENWIGINKHTNSAFESTNLAAHLRRLGITDVIVMGTNTGACVLASVQDAVRLGLTVHTAEDLVQQSEATYPAASTLVEVERNGKPLRLAVVTNKAADLAALKALVPKKGWQP